MRHPQTGVTKGKEGKGEVGCNTSGVSQDRNEDLGDGEVRNGIFNKILALWKLGE